LDENVAQIMSLLHLPQLLTHEELTKIDALIESSLFVDGAKTASLAAQSVKNNLQIDKDNTQTLPQLQAIILRALETSPLFQIATLPKHIYPIVFSKYSEGMTYGWHVDSPQMRNPQMGSPATRTDLAMTIFLSDPSTYEGGELLIQGSQGVTAYKPDKGDAVVYPCMYLHCVNPITQGERRAAVTWIQSDIGSVEKRQILFDMNQIHGSLYQKDPNSMEANLLLQTHSNLLRMWLAD
jgi:PKHD-type hydroxylase